MDGPAFSVPGEEAGHAARHAELAGFQATQHWVLLEWQGGMGRTWLESEKRLSNRDSATLYKWFSFFLFLLLFFSLRIVP